MSPFDPAATNTATIANKTLQSRIIVVCLPHQMVKCCCCCQLPLNGVLGGVTRYTHFLFFGLQISFLYQANETKPQMSEQFRMLGCLFHTAETHQGGNVGHREETVLTQHAGCMKRKTHVDTSENTPVSGKV